MLFLPPFLHKYFIFPKSKNQAPPIPVKTSPGLILYMGPKMLNRTDNTAITQVNNGPRRIWRFMTGSLNEIIMLDLREYIEYIYCTVKPLTTQNDQHLTSFGCQVTPPPK